MRVYELDSSYCQEYNLLFIGKSLIQKQYVFLRSVLMKKRVHEWLPMVLIAWRNKLRISLKYLKQFFSAPRFHKSRKRVSKWLTSVAVYPCRNSVL